MGGVMGTMSFHTITRRTLFGISGAIFVLYIIATILIGEFDPESLVFVGPFILLPLLTGLALRRWRGKTNLVAVAVALLALFFNLPFKDITNPTSTIDFIFQGVALFGSLIVIIAALMAFRGRSADEEPIPEQWVQYGFAALIVVPSVVAVIGLIGWIAGDSDISDADRSGAVVVEMKAFDFEPKSVSAAGKVLVSNNDMFRHNFTVEELDIDVEINPGREVVVDLSGNDAGTYAITCSIVGHEAMESELVLN